MSSTTLSRWTVDGQRPSAAVAEVAAAGVLNDAAVSVVDARRRDSSNAGHVSFSAAHYGAVPWGLLCLRRTRLPVLGFCHLLGNKRTAFAMTLDSLEQNGRSWGAPDVAVHADAVNRVAAGEAELEEIVDWIRQRTVGGLSGAWRSAGSRRRHRR
jgi:hypothetical protein